MVTDNTGYVNYNPIGYILIKQKTTIGEEAFFLFLDVIQYSPYWMPQGVQSVLSSLFKCHSMYAIFTEQIRNILLHRIKKKGYLLNRKIIFFSDFI